MELQTGRNTAWRPYQPPQLPLQPLAYHVNPRQQTQLAQLHPASAQSFADMACVLLWAGPTYAGALLFVLGVCREEIKSSMLVLQQLCTSHCSDVWLQTCCLLLCRLSALQHDIML